MYRKNFFLATNSRIPDRRDARWRFFDKSNKIEAKDEN